MNIEQKILEQIFDNLMKNDKYPDHFNFATDLRYDHSISYNPDNPTISLAIAKKGIQFPPLVRMGTKYVEITIPITAAAPPIPANVPTVLPECKSLGKVCMLVMAN